MKKYQNQIYSLPFIIFLFLAIIWALFGIFSKEKEPDPVKISVIVEDSNNARWTNFRLGLETAAKEHKVDLNYMTTANFHTFAEEKNLIEQKVQDGSDGLIIAPFRGEDLDEYYDPLSKEQIVSFVESSIDTEKQGENSILMVMPDSDRIVEQLEAMIKEDCGSDLSSKKIVICAMHTHKKNITDITHGITHKLLDDYAINIKSLDLAEIDHDLLEKTDNVDLIIALDDESLSDVAKILLDAGITETKLYGTGVSESSVYYLDKGIISGMVHVDDFNMGYQSIKLLSEKIRNKNIKLQSIEIETLSIRPETVHDPDNEKRLFPIVQ